MAAQSKVNPPFRADHVGSFLRPPALLEAREKARTGEIGADALKAVQDQHIRDVVAMQEAAGLKLATDGEFRRDWWHLDFLLGFDGIEYAFSDEARRFSGGGGDAPPVTEVAGKVKRTKPIMTEAFAFLKSVAKVTPKMCIPSPNMVHMRGGRASINSDVYPEMEPFWDDMVAAYRDEIADYVTLGCTYLQLDDVAFAYLCDETWRQGFAERGEDPDALLAQYARNVSGVTRDRPADLTVSMHMCRGNMASSWMAQGGYEPVAEVMFAEVDVDAFFMEFDTERAGGFEPLRFAPKDRTIVLGLVTSKSGDMESADDIKRRIDEATKYVALDNLCLSPQCGFSSTHHGNKLTPEAQRAKLEMIVEIADEVWG